MSVTISLLPLALAAASVFAGGTIAAAVRGTDEERTENDTDTAVSVRTRMKDRTLLEQALADIGATEIAVGDDVTAIVEGVRITLSRGEDEIWQAHLTGDVGDDELRRIGTDAIAQLDAAYALRVQQAVVQRIRDRAAETGFMLADEHREGDTVTMTLTVGTGT